MTDPVSTLSTVDINPANTLFIGLEEESKDMHATAGMH